MTEPKARKFPRDDQTEMLECLQDATQIWLAWACEAEGDNQLSEDESKPPTPTGRRCHLDNDELQGVAVLAAELFRSRRIEKTRGEAAPARETHDDLPRHLEHGGLD